MSADQFLDDVKVIDLSQYIPGPFATRQLADMGAQVIKIEPPAGDPMRVFMQSTSQPVSPIYQHLNRGKKISRLDLKTASGKQHLQHLLADADILLESYRPGVLDRLGFDRAQLESIKPDLIHCALSGYGQTGPYRKIAGHDLNYCAASGAVQVDINSAKQKITFPPLADHAGAMQASITMLAALYAGQKNSAYQFIDISLFESSLSWQYLALNDAYLDNADSISSQDLLGGGAACYNIYRCKDDTFISLAALELHFWQAFCTSVEKPEWINRQFETMPQKQLIAELSDFFVQQNRSFWDSLLSHKNCCYEPVLLATELRDHTQIQSRQSLTDFGPAYPAQFNGKALDTPLDFTELELDQPATWSNARTDV